MKDTVVTIRNARESEAALLTELSLASKAYWGYSPGFMQACRDELTVTAGDIGERCVVVAQHREEIAGFYMLVPIDRHSFELDALFVAPVHIGQGVGRRLVEHAMQGARAAGARRLVVQGDPHAEGFYVRAGATRIGSRDSASFPGRQLPLFEFDLAATAPA